MNPLRVLNLKKGATPRDILQAAAAALRERKYAVQDIALARQALMDSAAQAAFEFVSFLDDVPLPGPPGGTGPHGAASTSAGAPCLRPSAMALAAGAQVHAEALEYLPIFDKSP